MGSARLADITNQITDGVHKTPDYQESGIPFISTVHVNKEGIDWTRSKFISEKEHNELIKRCRPQRGDILYTKVGSVGLAVPVIDDREFSIFVQLALLKPKDEIVDQQFLTAQLNMPSIFQRVNSSLSGATMKYIGVGQIGEICVILPPLSVQNKFNQLMSMLTRHREGLLDSSKTINLLFSSLQRHVFLR